MDQDAGKRLRLVHGMTPLLKVQDLHVAYKLRTGETFPALAGLSFELEPGEILGVLGESGSGKSTLAASLLRLLPPNGMITRGVILFEGQNILQASPRDLEKIRGRRMALIFQEPSMALHPAMRVGDQVAEVLRAHESMDRATRRVRTRQVLAALFPSETERIADSYPHQLSGGQRQRILVAQAIVCGPALFVADEPTASLDPTTQQEILLLLRTLRQQLKLSMILITHNPALLADLADRVLVLYAGRVAEIGLTASVLGSPQHPYTRALLRCIPSHYGENQAGRKSMLPVISGDSPNLHELAKGCPFEPRCTERMEVCKNCDPAAVQLSEGHSVSCFKFVGG